MLAVQLLLVAIAVYVAYLSGLLFLDFWHWQKNFRLQRIRRQMVAKLESFGPQWVICTRGDIKAVCTLRAFVNALSDWKKKISEDPKTAWGPEIIRVEPVFTFTQEGGAPVYTGSPNQLADIAVDLVYDLLDKKYDKSLIRREIETLGKVIAKRDSRLYVPFVGDKWLPEWEAHRYTDIRLARLRLHKEVLDSTVPCHT